MCDIHKYIIRLRRRVWGWLDGVTQEWKRNTAKTQAAEFETSRIETRAAAAAWK